MKPFKLTYRGLGLLILCLLPVLSIKAQESFSTAHQPKDVLRQLNENGSHINSIRSKFIQEKHLQFLDETISSTGRFWFRKENSLRWAYEEPFEYAIIIHGNNFQILDGEKLNTYDIESNPVFREINSLISGMVQGKVAGDDRFELEVLESSSRYLVKMNPTDPNLASVISGMEVYFLRSDLQVDQVIIREGVDDFTLIRFTERTINESIPDSVFSTAY